jgi:hypothetical protein
MSTVTAIITPHVASIRHRLPAARGLAPVTSSWRHLGVLVDRLGLQTLPAPTRHPHADLAQRGLLATSSLYRDPYVVTDRAAMPVA